MGYKVVATFTRGEEQEDILVAQYGGDIVTSGRRAFDKVQKLLSQADTNGVHVLTAKVVRA